jgi:hypothetical protein
MVFCQVTNMEFLDLPFEILQLVLWHCSTPSFLQAAFSCHTIGIAASTSRKLILHQLSLTPGWHVAAPDSLSVPNAELLLLLRKCAAAQLYGADVSADAVTHTLYSNGPSIDPLASAVRAERNPNLAVVPRGGELVHVYRIRPGSRIEPVCTLQPPFKYTGRFQVLRVASP